MFFRGAKLTVLRAAAVAVLVALAATACSGAAEVTAVEQPPADAETVASPTAAPAEEPTAEQADTSPESDSSSDEADSADVTEGDDATERDDASEGDDATDGDEARLKPEAVNDLLGTSPTGADLDSAEVLCIVAALADDENLVTLLQNDADFESLDTEQQADVMVAAFDCAPDAIAEEFATFAGDDSASLPPEVAECFIESMSSGNPDRREVITGFAALGAERPVPDQSRDPVVDTMVFCIDGTALSGLLTEELLSDPTLAPAVNIDCVGTNFGGEKLRPMWEAMVDNPGSDFDQLDASQMGPILDAILGCISFGRVIAAEAASDGITLSEDTISCIDSEMVNIDIAALIETGEGAEQIGGVMLSCLSPEELQSIGG